MALPCRLKYTQGSLHFRPHRVNPSECLRWETKHDSDASSSRFKFTGGTNRARDQFGSVAPHKLEGDPS